MANEDTAKENKTTSRKRRKQTWFDVCLRAADRFMKNEMWRDAIEVCLLHARPCLPQRQYAGRSHR